jgi:hypothetical protein
MRSAIGAATSAPIKVPIESCRLLAHVFKYNGTTHQSNDKTGPDITEIEFASFLIELSKSFQKVRHCEKARNLASVISEA